MTNNHGQNVFWESFFIFVGLFFHFFQAFYFQWKVKFLHIKSKFLISFSLLNLLTKDSLLKSLMSLKCISAFELFSSVKKNSKRRMKVNQTKKKRWSISNKIGSKCIFWYRKWPNSVAHRLKKLVFDLAHLLKAENWQTRAKLQTCSKKKFTTNSSFVRRAAQFFFRSLPLTKAFHPKRMYTKRERECVYIRRTTKKWLSD